MKPFCKWVGSKRASVNALREAMPPTFNATYYEPFVGAGALFFDLRARNLFKYAVLSDANEKLVATYRAIREDVDAVIGALRPMRNTRRTFDEARERNMSEGSRAQRAADFLFLNRTCFNGLFRVNRQGQFNVPYGAYPESRALFDEENLRDCAHALRGVPVLCEDFRKVFKFSRPKAGDLVYFDPPYVPASKTASFTGFTAGGFTEYDQHELHLLAISLMNRGVYVMLSNSDTEIVRDLYANPSRWDLHEVMVGRSVNRDGAKRGKVKELLILGKKF